MFLCQGISIQRDLTKDQIRAAKRRERDSMPEESVLALSEKIEERFLRSGEYRGADILLLYIGVRSEVRTDRILRTALKEGRAVYCPSCNTDVTMKTDESGGAERAGGSMDFYRIYSGEDLTGMHYGIPEPEKDPSKLFRAEEVPGDHVLMVMPGVAFDEERNRIGYKGGYYDRYLGGHPDIHTAALSFDLQIVPFIRAEKYDVKPDLVITETRTI